MKTIFAILFSIFTLAAGATDYYVSNAGNNSSNGTTTGTSWATLSKVQSSADAGVFSPGDRILFKKGDSWTGTLVWATIWGHNAPSGTALNPITISSYGTGAKPIFQYPQSSGIAVTERRLFHFAGVNYINIDGLNFTDLVEPANDHKTPGVCGYGIYLGQPAEATTNYCRLTNIDMSLIDMGFALCGNFNKVMNCNLSNFKNLKSQNGNDDNDYGANAFTILGNDNEISNNYVAGAWAESLDYGWNGGACEMFNSCHRNKLLYNTFYDCGGISEFGAYELNATANDNLIAYNVIINCGGLTWVNTLGTFAIQASNIQFFNNTIIENAASRFSGQLPSNGGHLGEGLTTSSAIAKIESEQYLFAYGGTPNASTVFNLKNNIFQLSTGIKVRGNANKTTHLNNIYKITSPSTIGYTIGSSEFSTTDVLFTSTAGADPISWDFNLSETSPAINFGTSTGIINAWNGPIIGNPDAGVYERNTVVTPTPGPRTFILKGFGKTFILKPHQ